MIEPLFAQVIVDVPGVQAFDYSFPADVATLVDIGVRCVVPLGRNAKVGIVVGLNPPAIDAAKIKAITRALTDVEPLNTHWLQLTRFAADYYQHAWGEVALPALPRALRNVPGARHAQSLSKLRAHPSPQWAESGALDLTHTAQQTMAIDALVNAEGFTPHLLFGVTGSGKTEVYLSAIARKLASDPTAQALLLVPEINLTPQLESLLRARFPSEQVSRCTAISPTRSVPLLGWRRTSSAHASLLARGSLCSVRCRAFRSS